MGDTSTVPSTRRHWFRRALLGLVMVFIVGATTAAILAAHYQPLVPGSIGYRPPLGISVTETRVLWPGVPPGAENYQIPAQKGLSFDYRFTLSNSGPVPITVTQVGSTLAEQAGTGTTAVAVSINLNIYGTPHGGTWESVRPIVLRPRQEMAVRMRVTVTSCLQRGATAGGWSMVPVSFSVYGIHRDVFAPTNVQITLVGTQASC